jgi:hypothetical protein
VDPDYEVKGLPFPHELTYAGLLRMCKYLTEKQTAAPLDTTEEDCNGYKLYPKK